MKKDVLIVANEGLVRINNIHIGIRKEKLISIAQELIEIAGNEPIRELTNVEYYVNGGLNDWIQENYKNIGVYKPVVFNYEDVKNFGQEVYYE